MYAFLNKYGQALAFGIGVLVTVIFLLNILSTPEETMLMLDPDSGAGAEKYETTAFDFGLYASIGLSALAFLFALAFGLFQLASNPKGSLKGILGFVALIVIAGVAYATANDDLNAEAPQIVASIDKFNLDQGADFDGDTLKFVSGSIVTSLALIVLSIAALVVFGIRGIFK